MDDPGTSGLQTALTACRLTCNIDIDAPIQLSTGGSGSTEPSAEQVELLAAMGFTAAQAKKALRETVSQSFTVLAIILKFRAQGGDAERAVDWLFSHPDETGEEESAPAASIGGAARAAVGGSATLPARFRLKAFISHKGPSVHSGHYVAHIRMPDPISTGDMWVLFNDEKVVKADAESVRDLKRFAYLYVFERI